jgi:hypothetical protein
MIILEAKAGGNTIRRNTTTRHRIYVTLDDINIILGNLNPGLASCMWEKYTKHLRSEPPVRREADAVEDVFETVRHHRAECSG